MPRFRNMVRLLRSGNIQYVTRYYLDRIRWYSSAIARAGHMDLRYARRLLRGDMDTRYAHLGARSVHHTAYDILDHVFEAAQPQADDVLVDVGCGKGRVIIHWLHSGCGSRIVGLEIDPQLAARATRQFARFPRVQIIAGDAIANIPADGTLFYMYNPFTNEKVVEFEQRVHALSPAQRVRIVYYNPNFLDVFGTDRWGVRIIELNGRLDRGTLKRFCFPVAILDRIKPQPVGGSL